MTVSLKDYQERAVSSVVRETQKLLRNSLPHSKLLVFAAPTGSGKTVMLAEALQRLFEMNDNIAVIWATIGKGELHIQSRDALVSYYGSTPFCYLVDEHFGGMLTAIRPHEIAVINWEKIRSKDKDGTWKNLIMRDGEKVNFREILANTRVKSRLLLVIDESHYGTDTKRTSELILEFGAEVVIAASATPTLKPDPKEMALGRGAFCYIDPADVIAEGMIKKELLINDTLESIATDERTSEEAVLEAARAKHAELAAAFRAEGTKINPLCLIQLPNAEEGETKENSVRAFLARHGVTEANGKLAIWLSDRKSDNLGKLRSHTSPVEYLIFKQAVDTGWDCPRAHILVKFRESKSEIFEVQTVGRILRMPEHRHYADESLNRGYIYTNVPSITVKPETYNPNIIKHLRASLSPTVAPRMPMKSFYRSPAHYGALERDFEVFFERAMQAKFGPLKEGKATANLSRLEICGFVDDKGMTESLIASARIAAEQLETEHGLVVRGEGSITLQLSQTDLTVLFERLLSVRLGPFSLKQSLGMMKSAIYNWFGVYLGSEDWPESITDTQALAIRNYERIFAPALDHAVSENKIARDRTAKATAGRWYEPFVLATEAFYNSETMEESPSSSHIYQPCYLGRSRSRPERVFEEFVTAHSDSISGWWKNGEKSRDFFGIRYEINGVEHVFYPDFLVWFRDNRIGIFETKTESDTADVTKAKAEALQRYIIENRSEGLRLLGGIVIEAEGLLKLNSQLVYEPHIGTSWQDLITLF